MFCIPLENILILHKDIQFLYQYIRFINIGNKANKANKANNEPQATNGVSPKAPEKSLAMVDIDMKKSLLIEINRIDNWANVASDNGLFDTTKTKTKIFSKKFRRALRMPEKGCMQMNYPNQIMRLPKLYVNIIKISIMSAEDGDLPTYMVDGCGCT